MRRLRAACLVALALPFVFCSDANGQRFYHFRPPGYGIGRGAPYPYRYFPPTYEPYYQRSFRYRSFGRAKSDFGAIWYKRPGESRWKLLIDQTDDDDTQPYPLPVPTDKELQKMSAGELCLLLRSASAEFDNVLTNLKNGAGWKRYLRIEELRQLSTHAKDVQLTNKSREAVDDVLRKFESTNANEEYRKITELSGFRTLHVTLRELAKPERLQQHATATDTN